jgi:pimeloyl-ACP methyl ester carboxylesterase
MLSRLAIGAFALLLAAGGPSLGQAPTWREVVASGRLAPGAERDNWKNTYFTSWMAGLAYRPQGADEAKWKEHVRTQVTAAGFAEPDFPVRGAGAPGWIRAECFVTAHPSVVVVSFRGTDTPQDWFGNFRQVWPVDLRGAGPPARAAAHDGFQDAVDSVYPGILAAVRRQLGGGRRPLWVTGHSLGGALAALTALRLRWDLQGATATPPAVTVYSFSAPRICNPEFCRRFNQEVPICFRLTYRNDLVPSLPPPLGYDHVATQHHFTPQPSPPKPKPGVQPHPFEFREGGSTLASEDTAVARTALAKIERGEQPTGAEIEVLSRLGVFEDHNLLHLKRAAYFRIPAEERARFPAP